MIRNYKSNSFSEKHRNFPSMFRMNNELYWLHKTAPPCMYIKLQVVESTRHTSGHLPLVARQHVTISKQPNRCNNKETAIKAHPSAKTQTVFIFTRIVTCSKSWLRCKAQRIAELTRLNGYSPTNTLYESNLGPSEVQPRSNKEREQIDLTRD